MEGRKTLGEEIQKETQKESTKDPKIEVKPHRIFVVKITLATHNSHALRKFVFIVFLDLTFKIKIKIQKTIEKRAFRIPWT